MMFFYVFSCLFFLEDPDLVVEFQKTYLTFASFSKLMLLFVNDLGF